MYWKAIYKDGTKLSQRDNGMYTNIDRENLTEFRIYDDTAGIDGRLLLTLHLKPMEKFFYRRRTSKQVGGSTAVVHICGYTKRLDVIGGVLHTVVFAVFEGGNIEVSDGFIDQHPWLYPIVFRLEEIP